MNLKDLIKVAAPAALSAFAPGIGATLLPGVTNPALQQALVSGVGSMLLGNKPKDALISAALGGGLGFLGGQAGAAKPEQLSGGTYDSGPAAVMDMARKTGLSPADAANKVAEQAAKNISTKTAPVSTDTMSADLLQKMGMDSDSLLFKFMNSKVGEGVAAGILAQLLAGGDEDEGPAPGSYELRPFGAGGPGGQIGGIRYMNDGGDTYFPRRNGGIDPSEGSGKKDDVPAMLMAGEFVMTRDAVKGAGGGDLRKGIGKMYDMMDNFERMA
jgi:hypothetical protein